ncbi:MAG TPA: cytochrome C [Candidatus Binatia bacterium]|nr:cytochrome C [Candidatus Binatia bacterium]
MRPAPRRPARTATAVAAIVAALVAAALAACDDGRERRAIALTGGDPEHGRTLVRSYGCGTCHTVPGVRGARGLVGPPLDGLGDRVCLAGALPNTPENLMRWIRDPQGVHPEAPCPRSASTPKTRATSPPISTPSAERGARARAFAADA